MLFGSTVVPPPNSKGCTMAKRVTSSGKTRVSAKVKAAIDAMVFEALPRRKAAEKAGMLEHSLYKAMRKPPTLAYLREQMQVLRTSAGAEGVARVAHLMHHAGSEHVQLGAAQWMAGIEGVSPVSRSESLHLHQGLAPGLTINLIQAPPAMLDVTPVEHRPPPPAHALPIPVPHPSQRPK